MATFFISDLHLQASKPSVTERFLTFLTESSTLENCEVLYILGDFFEFWVGDDTTDQHDNKVIQALADFSSKGIPVYFMQGNRDFLIGKRFALKTGCKLIPDPTVIDLYGERVLLMHGDSLCTEDTGHQRFRAISQHPLIKKLFLCLPLAWRQEIAKKLRSQSRRSMQHTDPELSKKYDVTEAAVLKAFVEHQAQVLIHGHTHKPGIHETLPYKRIVLGEWGALGSVLVYTKNGAELKDV